MKTTFFLKALWAATTKRSQKSFLKARGNDNFDDKVDVEEAEAMLA